MQDSITIFESITSILSKSYDQVTPGKMMSAEGIKYKSKVFAFFHNDQMVFKMGKQFVPENHGITEYSYLSPFKNKPPMKGWLEVPSIYKDQWSNLTNMALEKLKTEIG